MTRYQQRREQIVGNYHRNMLISTLAISIGSALGLILVIALIPQFEEIGNSVAYWMMGLPPTAAASVLIFYFLFAIAFTCWIQYKRHEH